MTRSSSRGVRAAGIGALVLLVALGGGLVAGRGPFAATSGSAAQEVSMVADAGRAQESVDLGGIVKLAREQLGATYGGAVIDNRSRTLNVYATAPMSSEAQDAMKKMTGRAFKFNVIQVQYSLEQLEAVQSLVDGLAVTPLGQQINGTSLKVATNQVRVDLAEDASAEMLERVLAFGPQGVIEVGRGGRPFGWI